MSEDDGTKGAHGGAYWPPPQRYKDAQAEAERIVKAAVNMDRDQPDPTCAERWHSIDVDDGLVAALAAAIKVDEADGRQGLGAALDRLTEALSALRSTTEEQR